MWCDTVGRAGVEQTERFVDIPFVRMAPGMTRRVPPWRSPLLLWRHARPCGPEPAGATVPPSGRSLSTMPVTSGRAPHLPEGRLVISRRMSGESRPSSARRAAWRAAESAWSHGELAAGASLAAYALSG